MDRLTGLLSEPPTAPTRPAYRTLPTYDAHTALWVATVYQGNGAIAAVTRHTSYGQAAALAETRINYLNRNNPNKGN